MEVSNAKGTARLLHLSLPGSRLVTGEVFAQSDWEPLLANKQAVLLYPDTPEDSASGLATPPFLSLATLAGPSQLCLVVLDGTWRKSRKMLYQNPFLRQLPRLPLRGMPAARYVIRKAHKPDQLSTLEATCAALAQLEAEPARYVPLLKAFDGFVAQQLGYAS